MKFFFILFIFFVLIFGCQKKADSDIKPQDIKQGSIMPIENLTDVQQGDDMDTSAIADAENDLNELDSIEVGEINW